MNLREQTPSGVLLMSLKLNERQIRRCAGVVPNEHKRHRLDNRAEMGILLVDLPRTQSC